jgi:hypothetical protein
LVKHRRVHFHSGEIIIGVFSVVEVKNADIKSALYSLKCPGILPGNVQSVVGFFSIRIVFTINENDMAFVVSIL